MFASLPLKDRRLLLVPVLILLLALAVYFASYLPSADWYATFYPAARGVFSGHSPYDQVFFINPVWAVLLLFPFVIFPPLAAHGLFFVASFLVLVYLTWRLHAPVVAVVALLLSPTAVGGLLVNNLDVFVYLGVLLPPVWGLLLLMLKPQIGLGVALYYLVEIWRQSRAGGLLRVFTPVTLAYLLCALIFPVWVERMLHNSTIVWNRSMFPYSIPLGLFFLWLAIRRRNVYFALAAGPFLAPYISFYSYLAVQVALLHEDVEKVVRRDVLQVVLSIFLWVVMLTFHL